LAARSSSFLIVPFGGLAWAIEHEATKEIEESVQNVLKVLGPAGEMEIE
jgi:hypothetical protein